MKEQKIIKLHRFLKKRGLKKEASLVKDIIKKSQQEVYHGSSELRKNFSPEFQNELGFHFGESREQAEHRSKYGGKEGVVGKYIVNITNPLILDDVMKWTPRNVIDEMVNKRYLSYSDGRKILDRIMKGAASLAKESGQPMSKAALPLLTEEIEKMGFDGIKYQNRGEGGGVAWIALRPEQITLVEQV